MLSKEITPEEYIHKYTEFCNRMHKGIQSDAFSYDEGIFIEIYDKEYLQNPNTKQLDGAEFPEWVKIDIPPMFGKQVISEGEIGILIGFSYSFLDYYYIILVNKKIVYWSCVGQIEVIS